MGVPLFVQTILQKTNKLQTLILAMELIVLPTATGLVSTLLMTKSSVVSHLPNNLVPTLFKSLLSSPIYIIMFMNLMVALIAASSYFDNLNKYFLFRKTSSLDDGASFLPDPPLPSSSPPPPFMPLPSAPPIDDTQIPAPHPNLSETHFLSHENWKDIIEVAEASNKIDKMYSLQSFPDVDIISGTGSRIDYYEDDRQIQVGEGLFKEEEEGHDEDGDNSLEEMWKVIKGGGENSGKPGLKKSETCPIDTTNIGTVQSIDSRGLLPTAAAAWKELRKTVTFDDTISMRKRGGLMRDSLMSQESLGKRADAFINSIRNNMRIEREESIIRSRNIRNIKS